MTKIFGLSNFKDGIALRCRRLQVEQAYSFLVGEEG